MERQKAEKQNWILELTFFIKTYKLWELAWFWAEIREYFSVLNLKPTNKEHASSKRYKCFLVSYKRR